MQRFERSIRVQAPIQEVYEYWRNFENFPSFMDEVEELRLLDLQGERSHWKVRGPMGMTVEYDARLTTDEPNRSIAWNSEGGSVETTGAVTFAEHDNNTEVHVVLQWYDPPAGAVGEAIGHMLQNGDAMLENALHRFKDIVEGRTVHTRS